jgi:hypothetical protein
VRKPKIAAAVGTAAGRGDACAAGASIAAAEAMPGAKAQLPSRHEIFSSGLRLCHLAFAKTMRPYPTRFFGETASHPLGQGLRDSRLV